MRVTTLFIIFVACVPVQARAGYFDYNSSQQSGTFFQEEPSKEAQKQADTSSAAPLKKDPAEDIASQIEAKRAEMERREKARIKEMQKLWVDYRKQQEAARNMTDTYDRLRSLEQRINQIQDRRSVFEQRAKQDFRAPAERRQHPVPNQNQTMGATQ